MTATEPSSLEHDVASLRAFNRFYTKRAGILEPFLGGTLSLTEARVIYELAQTETMTASELSKALEIDAGYLSRMLKRFESSGWIKREASVKDGRQTWISLLPAGQDAYAPLHEEQQKLVTATLTSLSPSRRAELMASLTNVQRILDGSPPPEIIIRGLEVGDIGWMTQVNGEFYKRTYGWSIGFEVVVAEIMCDLVRTFRPGVDRIWIAMLDGKRVGGVHVRKKSEGVAKLSMLYVDPAAQGMGLGKRLVNEVVGFAKEGGYERLELRTEKSLIVARKLYAKVGFVLEKTAEPHYEWGAAVHEETWAMTLKT